MKQEHFVDEQQQQKLEITTTTKNYTKINFSGQVRNKKVRSQSRFYYQTFLKSYRINHLNIITALQTRSLYRLQGSPCELILPCKDPVKITGY